MNNLVKIATDFLKNINKNRKQIEKYSVNTNWLLTPLKHLVFPEDMTLGMYTAGGGLGSHTEIYFHNNDATEPYQMGTVYTPNKIILYNGDLSTCFDASYEEPLPALNYIRIDEFLPESIWEAYLLTRVSSFLPLFWHGGYMLFKYIFSKEDLIKVHNFTDDELKNLEKYQFEPIVEHRGFYKDKYDWGISFYEWSEWGGLFKTFVHVRCERGGSVHFYEEKQKNIFKYNCGICF